MHRRILIVGGVAGGASAAARLRRLDEQAEIIVLDRGAHVSFANCGLPYYVGDVIQDEEDLLLATPELFERRFNIDVRTHSDVLSVDRATKTLKIRDLREDREYEEIYDALVLSPGAKPARPPIPGIDHPRIFSLRTIPDSRKIKAVAAESQSAVIIGGGFIGLEMAENLKGLGLDVTLVELADQIMGPIDKEMAILVEQRLRDEGVRVLLGQSATRFRDLGTRLAVELSGGEVLDTDFVLLATGVRPEATLAREAGLDLGKRGGILVDEFMRTVDPHIWAVGDAVEVRDLLTDNWELIPLAGPANRQGRVAAENIAGRDGDHEVKAFRGVQGTAVAGIFGLTAAATGASEKTLKRAGITEYERIYLHPDNHVGYYPGATSIALKLLFSTVDGRILGAQAVGEQGVERRVDVIAMSVQMGGTVYDLEEAELAYAPQFGAAKDPVNVAGMIAVNTLRGNLKLARWEELDDTEALLLDVRNASEFAAGRIEGAVHMDVDELRKRAPELPRDREIWLICEAGKRAYYAARTLEQLGFEVRDLPGGMKTYRAFRAATMIARPLTTAAN